MSGKKKSNLVLTILKWVFIPTLMLAVRAKNHIDERFSSAESKGHHRKLAISKELKKRNWRYLKISICFVIIVAIFDFIRIRASWDIVSAHWLATGFYFAILLGFSWYAFSRALEIFTAFIKDAVNQTKHGNKKNNSSLKGWERIQLALKSYVELILDFGMIYYTFSSFIGSKIILGFSNTNGDFWYLIGHWFKGPNVRHILDAVYFSGITITTTGYGDLAPFGIVIKLFTLFEVITGILLLVVCFTLYSKDPESPDKRTLKVLIKKGKSS